MMTNRQLRWWYGRYNNLYFKGKLPRPQKIYFSNIRVLGRSLLTEVGNYDFKVCWVKITKKLLFASVVVHCTLLHEMIHIDLHRREIKHNRMKKGDIFEKEVRRLLRAGAYTELL